MNKIFKFNFFCYYIDPGTGGVVFGSIGPFIAVGIGFILAFFAIFRNYLKIIIYKVWKYKWLAFILLIILSAIIYFFLNSTINKNDMHFKKILVVGIDGLDPDICRELIQKGKMPNLKALISNGTFEDLQIINPAQSPVSWSCLACGVNPGKHGIFDFIHRDPKTYLPRLSICSPAARGSSSLKNDLKANVKVPLFGLPTVASALNVAVNLYGQEILLSMMTDQEATKHDLKIINDSLCEIHKWYIANVPLEQLQPVISWERTQPPGFGQLCGCTTQLVSPDMYNDFIAPLDEQLLSVYPNGGMIHLCGSHTQHIPTWRNMKIFTCSSIK